jgi:RNA polymerase sigma factor (sigma-70 family)
MARETMKQDKLTKLAVRMKRGDRKAAAELYDDMMPKVYGFLFTRTSKREVAEDLAQDVFIKLIDKVTSYDETRGAFVVWFWQMVRRMLIDYYRKKQETPFSHFEESTIEGMAIVDELPNLDASMRYQQLSLFLQTLSGDERELFEYRYVAEMPYSEIAVVMGRTEGALRVAALRIKEKIKKELPEKN